MEEDLSNNITVKAYLAQQAAIKQKHDEEYYEGEIRERMRNYHLKPLEYSFHGLQSTLKKAVERIEAVRGREFNNYEMVAVGVEFKNAVDKAMVRVEEVIKVDGFTVVVDEKIKDIAHSWDICSEGHEWSDDESEEEE